MFNLSKTGAGLGSKSTKSCDLGGSFLDLDVHFFVRHLFDQLDTVTKAISRKKTSKRGFLREWLRWSGLKSQDS